MNRNFLLGALAATMAILPVGCSNDEPEKGGKNPFTPVNLPQSSRSAVTAENEFSADLFKFFAVGKGTTVNESNFCLSPFSAYASLAVLIDGASSPTKEVLLDMLAGNNASLTAGDISGYISTMSEVLPRLDKHSKCNVDYALWHDADMTLTPGFEQSLKQTSSWHFKIFNQSPAGEAGMKGINNWVKSATNGEIPEFLDRPLDSSVEWTLLNACYFKGKWKEKFNPDKSTDGIFDAIDGTRSNKVFMHQTEEYSYSLSDGVNYLRVPFGNGNFVMNLMLPEASDGYQAMVSNLSAAGMQTMKEKAAVRKVELSLPKFSEETELRLTSYLADRTGEDMELMLDKLFDGYPTQISFMVQKNRIEIDEKGAVAASATGTGVCTSPWPQESVELNFNRPFIYTIEESSTGTILYIGTMVK